jgi:hypothetical protein
MIALVTTDNPNGTSLHPAGYVIAIPESVGFPYSEISLESSSDQISGFLLSYSSIQGKCLVTEWKALTEE